MPTDSLRYNLAPEQAGVQRVNFFNKNFFKT